MKTVTLRKSTKKRKLNKDSDSTYSPPGNEVATILDILQDESAIKDFMSARNKESDSFVSVQTHLQDPAD
eukprot:3686892-Ditylum_brightwellii.AAC.1